MSFQFVQLTNQTVGAVATGALLPLGNLTHRYYGNGKCACSNAAITASTTGNNTINLNGAGYYEIEYTLSGVAGAAGVVTVGLLQNGLTTPTITSSQTAGAAGDTVNITLHYVVLVPRSCPSTTNIPSTIQLNLIANTLTGGVSNLTVKRIA